MKVSRRSFLKASAGAAAVAATYKPPVLKWLTKAAAAKPVSAATSRVVKNFCHLCGIRSIPCGIDVEVREGRVVKVLGMPEHPTTQGTLCPRGLAMKQFVYAADRLKYPLKRTRPKGDPDPGWVRISWDEAMDTIVNKLKEIKEKYGAEALATFGGRAGAFPFAARWANLYGTPNGAVNSSLCHTPRVVNFTYTHGRGPPSPDYANTKLIVHWGSSRAHSAPMDVLRVVVALERGAKLIIIDPSYHPSFTAKADIWLPLRPGTDGALALSFMNVIINESLFDRTFVEQWTNGPFLVRDDNGLFLREADVVNDGNKDKYMVWDTVTASAKVADTAGVKPALLGKYTVAGIACTTAWQLFVDLVNQYPPEKAAEITWIPAEQIREVARLYATTKPACLLDGNGLDMQTNISMTTRAIGILRSITGNLDVRGGDIFGITAIPTQSIEGSEFLPEAQLKKRIGGDKYPIWCFYNPKSSSMPDVWTAVLTGKPYPIRALINDHAAVLTTGFGNKRTAEALKKLEFFVMQELFMSPAAEYADIVLPFSTTTERDDEYKITGTHIMLANKAIEPLWECRSDRRFWYDLAVKMGFGKDFWDGDIEKSIDYELKPTGITYKDLKNNPAGIWVKAPTMEYQKYRTVFARLQTKKVEIYSEFYKTVGKVDPLPVYREPAESPISTPALTSKYPFIYTDIHSDVLNYHAMCRNLPWLREIRRDAWVRINPKTAKELGIKDGDMVIVESPRGYIKVKAQYYEGIHPKVVLSQHGWWQGCQELGLPATGHLDGSANVNVITDDTATDPVTVSPSKVILVNIRKA